MTRRMIIMLVVVAVVAGAIVGFNAFKARMIRQFMASNAAPPATVTTLTAEVQEWQPQIAAVGSLRAVRGVDVTTEIAGMVRSLHFRSGDEVKAGQLLVQLNADADAAQLRSLQAAADLAASVLERDRAQLAAQAISQAQVDADVADLASKRALVAQQQATLEKKSIRAPFAGKIGITTVNPGQYLNPGDKIVTLQALDPVYADFSLPQRQAVDIAVGQVVSVASDAHPEDRFAGRVNAIDPRIDTATRNLMIEAAVPNPRRALVPGMFVDVRIDTGEKKRYLTVPQTAITFNPYGATVFLAQDSGKKDAQGNPVLEARQVFVKPGPTRGDQVAILDGLEPGATVITSGQLKLKNGTPLVVNNEVVPANDPNPRPRDE
ncbi:MAG: efflux RND transporter periplasmic adaptor subunit [Burkholderiales bacterium]|nr:efflux RND transporter periplasmic adaptor subunit [Burkholderiales bacterium]OJX09298.1 MAG: efflux transporter periplasmic adaptor subunit [Burkholderiales bacterium 70-64]